jgi:hypothetical protein
MLNCRWNYFLSDTFKRRQLYAKASKWSLTRVGMTHLCHCHLPLGLNLLMGTRLPRSVGEETRQRGPAPLRDAANNTWGGHSALMSNPKGWWLLGSKRTQGTKKLALIFWFVLLFSKFVIFVLWKVTFSFPCLMKSHLDAWEKWTTKHKSSVAPKSIYLLNRFNKLLFDLDPPNKLLLKRGLAVPGHKNFSEPPGVSLVAGTNGIFQRFSTHTKGQGQAFFGTLGVVEWAGPQPTQGKGSQIKKQPDPKAHQHHNQDRPHRPK